MLLILLTAPLLIFFILICMSFSVSPERALKLYVPLGFDISLKRLCSLFLQSMSQERAWPGWGDLRKLDDFPVAHESGVHGLILLFKVNSWNITHFLISVQKHLHCQVMSFGVTSMDPPGSLLFRMGEMDWERQAGIYFCKAFWGNGEEFGFWAMGSH